MGAQDLYVLYTPCRWWGVTNNLLPSLYQELPSGGFSLVYTS